MERYFSLLLILFALQITSLETLAATDYFTVTESTPAGCLNIQAYGATPNDTADDTIAIQAAIDAANSQGYDIFVPAGRYVISAALVWKNGVSMSGSHIGISMLEGTGSWFASGDNTWGVSIDDVNIKDIYFLNTGIAFGGGYYKERYLIKNCVFMQNASFASDYSLFLNYITNGTVEDCIFMRQANGFGVGSLTYKTRDCLFQRNIFGLDLQNIDWLGVDYSGFGNWSELIEKLEYLKATASLNLDWDQGQFKAGWYVQYDERMEIRNNIFNGSPLCAQDRDHAIYAKAYTDLEIISNYFRGWPQTAYGGLKLRNTNGWSYVVANYFDDVFILQYTYLDGSLPAAYKNALVYKNYFMNRTFDCAISYWENTAGDDWNIIYAENLFDAIPGITSQIKQNNGDPAGYTVYDSNIFLPTGYPVTIQDSGKAYATGAPDPALTSPYATATVPYLKIPPFSKGWTYNLISQLFNFDLATYDTVAELQTAGWTFNQGQSIYSVSMDGVTRKSLKLNGGTSVRPEAVYPFPPSSKGTVSFSGYMASSGPLARVDILDSSNIVLASVYLQNSTSVAIECAAGGLGSSAIPNGGSNNLLSAGTKGWSDFKIEWNGPVFNWYWTHRLQDGTINHQQFGNSAVFNSGGAPAKIRMRIDAYDVSSRHFGVTDLFVGYTPQFNFDLPVYDTTAELQTAGWSFTQGQSIFSVSMAGVTRKSLKLNGGVAARPEAVYLFPPSSYGTLTFSAYMASSGPLSRVDLLDGSDFVLASVYLPSAAVVAVECASGGLSSTAIPNGGSNNLLSAGTKGWSDFKIQWSGTTFNWYWTHRLENGTVNYQTSGTGAAFYSGGTPAKIRMRNDLYDVSSRHFGVTDMFLWPSGY